MRIKEAYFNVKNRFLQFSSRDQKMILVGIFAIGFYLGYALVVSPIFSHLHEMRKNIAATQTLLSWMQGADRMIKELKKDEYTRTRPESVVAFLSVLKQGIEGASLQKSLSQLRQVGDDSIDLHFQNVNFDQAIGFIASILRTHDVHITQFSVTKLTKPGLTNIDVVMKVTTTAVA